MHYSQIFQGPETFYYEEVKIFTMLILLSMISASVLLKKKEIFMEINFVKTDFVTIFIFS